MPMVGVMILLGGGGDVPSAFSVVDLMMGGMNLSSVVHQTAW